MNEDSTPPEETLEACVNRLLDSKGRTPTYLDDLEDAVGQDENGLPYLRTDLTGHVVVEKWISTGMAPRWLGTEIYRVTSVNAQTGDVVLYDELLHQTAHSNIISGPKRGWRFKVPPKKLNLKDRERSDYLERYQKKR